MNSINFWFMNVMQHGQKGKGDPNSEETQARSVFLSPTLVFRLKTRTAFNTLA